VDDMALRSRSGACSHPMHLQCARQWLSIPTSSYHAPKCAICRAEFFLEAPSQFDYRAAFDIIEDMSAQLLTGSQQWPPDVVAFSEPTQQIATSEPTQQTATRGPRWQPSGLMQSQWAPPVDDASGIAPIDDDASGIAPIDEGDTDLRGTSLNEFRSMMMDALDQIHAPTDLLWDRFHAALERDYDLRLRDNELEESPDDWQSDDNYWWTTPINGHGDELEFLDSSTLPGADLGSEG
jgi:hypothetical protein